MKYLSIILLIFCVSFLGCSDSNSIERAFAKSSGKNIQKSCAMYQIYSTLHNFKGPKDVNEMIEFLESSADVQTRFENLNIDADKLESYLIGRDGEQFQFRWRVRSSPINGSYPVCWEQTGVDGIIQVGVTGGIIIETSDEDELNNLKKGKYVTAQRQ